MCLLIHKPANVTFTEVELRDFYQRNQDGYGVMFAEDGKLHSQKALGSVDDWVKFYKKHEHREMCIHLRMRTHGDIDLTNCHPYPVYGFEGEEVAMPMLLMHNGVLQTGNAKDASKSDTWHYIRDWLRPMLDSNPEFVHTPQFKAFVGSHIGSNRFALMTADGRVAIVNRAQGVEYKGAWFSNTYAWSANTFMPRPQGQYGLWDGWVGYSGSKWGQPMKASSPAKGKAVKATPPAKGQPKLKPATKAIPTSALVPIEDDYFEISQWLHELKVYGVERSRIEYVVQRAGLGKVYDLLEGVFTKTVALQDVANVFKTAEGLAWLVRTPAESFKVKTTKEKQNVVPS